MEDQIDEFEPTVKRVLRAPRSRKRDAFVLLVVLGIAFAAGSYLWLNYDSIAKTASSVALSAPDRTETAAEGRIPLRDFQAFQKQATDSLQMLNADLAAQKADLQRLSDQLSVLATRLDAMQRPAPVAPPEQAVAARPTITPKKKPSAPKTSGPISVGGAPLPAASNDGR